MFSNRAFRKSSVFLIDSRIQTSTHVPYARVYMECEGEGKGRPVTFQCWHGGIVLPIINLGARRGGQRHAPASVHPAETRYPS
jgi:hypothetical protein